MTVAPPLGYIPPQAEPLTTGREPMNDDSPLPALKDPRLAARLDDLRRALEKASPADRAFVLHQLQTTARGLAG